MDWQRQCVAVIPCHNEAANISQVISAVKRYLPTVLVVDDGSVDRTADLAREAGAEVLAHEQCSGKGLALQTGWARAHQLGFDWVLCLDGDGQHDAADGASFFACAEQTGADLVIGNRMAAPGSMPWIRRCVNWWMSRELSRLAGQPLSDTQCGFRLMRLAPWEALQLQTGHFEIESELLLAFARAGHRIRFVPIRVIYENERSKISPMKDTIRWFRWLRQVRANRHASP